MIEQLIYVLAARPICLSFDEAGFEFVLKLYFLDGFRSQQAMTQLP